MESTLGMPKKCVEEINQLVVQETMKQVHYLVV